MRSKRLSDSARCELMLAAAMIPILLLALLSDLYIL
jgi:hypothetical protein